MGSQLSDMSLPFGRTDNLDHSRNALLNGDCGLLITKSFSARTFEVRLDPAVTCE